MLMLNIGFYKKKVFGFLHELCLDVQNILHITLKDLEKHCIAVHQQAQYFVSTH